MDGTGLLPRIDQVSLKRACRVPRGTRVRGDVKLKISLSRDN